ncbi:hypothetical protein HZS_5356 [Henneguya salminicola]|nr:hypothetical protein HZS_5356 [Henneguya salminicola]
MQRDIASVSCFIKTRKKINEKFHKDIALNACISHHFGFKYTAILIYVVKNLEDMPLEILKNKIIGTIRRAFIIGRLNYKIYLQTIKIFS